MQEFSAETLKLSPNRISCNEHNRCDIVIWRIIMKSVGRKIAVIALMSLFAFISLGAKTENSSVFEEIDPVYFETDVAKLIQIHRVGDVTKKRDALIQYVWGGKGFPSSKQPAKVEEKIEDERYANLFKAGLKQIDRITMLMDPGLISMDPGLISIAYHFIPKKGNNKLIIYHQGHRGDFITGIDTIAAFLGKGYSVMAFSMPLKGMNNKPTVYLERFGKFKVERHEHLKLLADPIKYFMEPMAVGLNYAAKFKYDQVHMSGISGGGWTTTIYAAIDTRIMHSFPVAGSYPIYLRSESGRDWGDFEQTLPDLYRIANYPELYAMGSFGNGRKQIQMLNQYDSCCFAGVKWRTYEKAVKEAVADLGKGQFRVFLDNSHKEHKISAQALKVIFDDLESLR